MEIKVLGTGCSKCIALEKAVKETVEENGIEAVVTKIEDIVEIMAYGIMSTPAIVIDGKVLVKGRVPASSELKELLTNKNK
ncbi:TM0996/MTH895 family glutaredoxin-like protein [bacterium]|nr:TM0996/MTH895 family glutaredoxin-like protein [bacterium]